MDLSEFLVPSNILPGLKVTSKKQVFQELAECAANATGLEETRVAHVLFKRERLGGTGVGNGIAIPHARMAKIDRLYGFFARLEKSVDFDAIDGTPVDLVFLLLAPEDASAEHLKALARISRILRDHSICKKLRGSQTADALYALLTESATPHAA
jgi:PTS system nitrogen regulatory IIA component